MLIYHQCGHNFVWNMQSLLEDRAGDGLIISPVNVEADRIRDRIPRELLSNSWVDPQFYLPDDSKSKLATYPFFPANVLDGFSTTDYQNHAFEVAKACLIFQNDLGLKYLVIPTRYFEDLPDNYLEQLESLFLEPFVKAKRELRLTNPLFLTVITKPLHLEPGMPRDELLSWATSYAEVSGIYLIFDNNFHSKQIKDPKYLADALRFVRALRFNDLEVHIGYSGLEGLLFSVADPTSVSVGSYENLRSFDISRLVTREPSAQQGPRPRVYSGRLLQWIEDTALPPLRELMLDWKNLFDDSPYKEYLLDSENSLNFQRSEIYKHYFLLFSKQVAALPAVQHRTQHIKELVMDAMVLFEQIEASGVFLDPNSDHSHLPAWLNALAMYQRQPE